MIFEGSWRTLAMFSAALDGGASPLQTPPLLTWFSSFLVRSSANFAKKIQELAEDKAENPRTCRGQSREENPYERLQENSNLQAFFFQTPFLIATLPTPKTLGGGTPPRGASIQPGLAMEREAREYLYAFALDGFLFCFSALANCKNSAN